MKRVPQVVRRGKKDRRMGEPSELDWEAIEALNAEVRIELIQELLPLGLAEVGRTLGKEVECLAGQRHPVRVPRVRGSEGEIRLESYGRLHGAAGEVNEGLFRKVLLGISYRDYEAAAEAVPGARSGCRSRRCHGSSRRRRHASASST